jgi:hypothetical protein
VTVEIDGNQDASNAACCSFEMGGFTDVCSRLVATIDIPHHVDDPTASKSARPNDPDGSDTR